MGIEGSIHRRIEGLRALFVDDSRGRWMKFQMANIGRVAEWAEGARQAIRLLQEREYGLVSLDHDLRPEDYNAEERCPHADDLCGMAVARFIASRRRRFRGTVIHVHSLSDSAREMAEVLTAAGLRVLHRPFGL